jgi:uncharacterized membrane protein
MHHHRNGSPAGSTRIVAAAALTIAAATGFAVARHWMSTRPIRPPEDAPRKSLRSASGGWREHRVAGRTVTIARPRQEVYARWRDAERFPEFMETVTGVERVGDGTFRWTIKAPAGEEVTFTTRTTEDRPGEAIAWESVEGAAIRNSGRVAFRDAPGDRGTQVDLTIAYDPPGGALGELFAFLFQREPALQARRDLRRFKQLMETGEVAVAPGLPVRNPA